MSMSNPPRRTYVLSDLYDADLRTTDPVAARLAANKRIPHPLKGVQYADGIHPPGWTTEKRPPAVAPSPRVWCPCGCGATWCSADGVEA